MHGSLEQLLRVEQVDVLVAHVADFGVGDVDLEAGFRVGPQQVHGWPLDFDAIEPLVIIAGQEDRRHAVMDRAHLRAGLHGDNRETLKPVAVGRLPAVPWPAKAYIG